MLFNGDFTFFSIKTLDIITNIPIIFLCDVDSHKNITDIINKNNEFKLFTGVTSDVSPVASEVT